MDLTTKLKCLLTIVLVSSHIQGHVCNETDPNTDVEKMRSLLNNARETNRKLEWQNKRLMVMWSSFAQMCRTLQRETEEPQRVDENILTYQQEFPEIVIAQHDVTDDKGHDSAEDEANVSIGDTKDADADKSHLHINSINTKGGSFLNITINYTAPDDHSTDWIASLDNNGELRSPGNRRSYPGPMFTVYELYFDPAPIQELSFRLSAGDQSVQLQFNILELTEPGEQIMPEYPGDIIFSQLTYTASYDEDLLVVATLPEAMSADIISVATDVFFNGLNATTFIPEPFAHSSRNGDVITVAGNMTNNVSLVTISIKSEYARYGGMLTVRPASLSKMDRFVLHLSYDRYVTIKSPDTGDVIPRNRVGLVNIKKQTTIATEFFSLWCSAIGNPTPEVRLLRQLTSGKTNRKRTQTVLSGQYSTIVVHTISYSDTRQGLYICSATSGNYTAEETTEVKFYSPIVFNKQVSGVVSNATEGLQIKCKATGIPEPQLEFRDGAPNGPQLLVHVTQESQNEDGKLSTTLMATVANTGQLKVFCVGKQEGLDTSHIYEING